MPLSSKAEQPRRAGYAVIECASVRYIACTYLLFYVLIILLASALAMNEWEKKVRKNGELDVFFFWQPFPRCLNFLPCRQPLVISRDFLSSF